MNMPQAIVQCGGLLQLRFVTPAVGRMPVFQTRLCWTIGLYL